MTLPSGGLPQNRTAVGERRGETKTQLQSALVGFTRTLKSLVANYEFVYSPVEGFAFFNVEDDKACA